MVARSGATRPLYSARMKRLYTLVLALALAACGRGPASGDFDPLALAQASAGHVGNPDAVVPPQCYTRTDGVANPCWTCHTARNGRNLSDDVRLQERYAFKHGGMRNRWDNLFQDRRTAIAGIDDAQMLTYLRQDNYSALRDSLRARRDYPGWRPDLDFSRGFDAEGFARDGSGWRAFRYKPFPGTFWPTNGSTDDIAIRLPRFFYSDAQGRPSREIYKINLAILEAALAVPDTVPDAQLRRRIEPVDETLAGMDLDGDGRIAGTVTLIRGLPLHYAGGAAGVGVTRHLYPINTEFLHTVRYLDPDAPDLASRRMKEVRYAIKTRFLAGDDLAEEYREEAAEDRSDRPPVFAGTPVTGVTSPFGWRLQGFIEDAQGRLRLQTQEEHQFCMGCHTGLGITVDQSFGFPRKRPGVDGWGAQSLAGMPDAPQAGQREPETLVYFRRARGGDEFRANDEVLGRYFPAGALDEAKVRAAQDLRELITPSRERALLLDKASLALVRQQDFAHGRDALPQPAVNVHRSIQNGDTGLKKNHAVYDDGRLWLDWPEAAGATPP